MSGKRQAESLDDTSPAKKQKLDNGVASNGGAAPAQATAASMMEKIAKAKKLLESQKALQAKLAAAKLKVRLRASGRMVLSQGATLTCTQAVYQSLHCTWSAVVMSVCWTACTAAVQSCSRLYWIIPATFLTIKCLSLLFHLPHVFYWSH